MRLISMSNNDITRLQELFSKYETITPAEQAELDLLLDNPDKEQEVKALIGNAILQVREQRPLDEESSQAILQSIFRAGRKRGARRINLPRIKTWQAAAAILIILVLGSGVYLSFFRKPAETMHSSSVFIPKDILPGSNGAELTLANGSTISLDSAGNGVLTLQGQTRLIKRDKGQLNYEARGKDKEVLYNTLSTRRGKQFSVTLPDGTRVWLNAASSLHYPTAFTGKERKVDLTGEAFFEVAPGLNPFIVSTNGMEVQVLGTQFNINAYEDEAMIRTTLLEGGIRVVKDSVHMRIKPGQQADLSRDGILHLTDDADTEQAVAWKNGYTSFKSADLNTIMRQVSRWYDVDIVYEGNIPERTFTGEVSRNSNLSKLLEILTVSEIHFRIEGKLLRVLP